MRLAVADLLFCWPPHGGADVDLFHVADGLCRAGHDLHLFGLHIPGSWERGAFHPETLPFPATRIDIPRSAFKAEYVAHRIAEAVDAWRPEAVLLADGFFLKPYLVQALAHYPLVSRYYAHEALCHRDILRFKNGQPCPKDYFATPEDCRRCALAHLGPDIARGRPSAWIEEYLAAHAYAPDYYGKARESLRQIRAAVVSNGTIKQSLAPYCPEVFCIPGGVDTGLFSFTPCEAKNDRDCKTILMSGRGEDPAKGLAVLLDAGERLRAHRSDFEIWVTVPEDTPLPSWARPLGWRDQAALAESYRHADICVVPSIWDEPFGLIALEAMASGRPVCASRVGGLQDIVADGETGHLFPRGDSAVLASHLDRLLDNPAERTRLGTAGRRRAETEYAWDTIIQRHYLPLLDFLRTSRTSPKRPVRTASIGKKRLAFVDLIFSWPPNGGADVELFQVIQGLRAAGYETHLFVAHEAQSTERGRVDPDSLPFPATRLEFTPRTLTPEYMTQAFRKAVDGWGPDLVFLTHGYTLKPYLTIALAQYPLAARYYAHELLCARDALRFKDGKPCPKNYFETPEDCRRCALESQKRAIIMGPRRTWTSDYLAAKAYAPGYYETLLKSLRVTDTLLVNNPGIQSELVEVHHDVQVFHPGVNIADFPVIPPPCRRPDEKKVVLLAGRAEDPLKGLDTLLAAGERLARQRNDFEIWATHFDHTLSGGFFKALGWQDHASAIRLYAQCDICVAPSLWEEPFGLAAIEAMASARPVCASRTGGLKNIVGDGETGYLFEAGDAKALAQHLEGLLDDPALCARMGAAGRAVVEAHYDWQGIIREQYLPLIARLTP